MFEQHREECITVLNEIFERADWFCEQYKTGALDNFTVTKEEYCSGFRFMPRGYYNPSPVRELIVGNEKRGRLLKQLTSRTKRYYRYLYDDGVMRRTDLFNGGKLIETTYLFHDDNIVWEIGKYVQPQNDSSIPIISKEVYENDVLMEYSVCSLYKQPDLAWCAINFSRESYEYDDVGVCVCYFQQLSTTHQPPAATWTRLNLAELPDMMLQNQKQPVSSISPVTKKTAGIYREMRLEMERVNGVNIIARCTKEYHEGHKGSGWALS